MDNQERKQAPRLARFYMDWRELARLLDLPEDVSVRYVFNSPERAGFGIVLEGERFPVAREGYEIEQIEVALEYVPDVEPSPWHRARPVLLMPTPAAEPAS